MRYPTRLLSCPSPWTQVRLRAPQRLRMSPVRCLLCATRIARKCRPAFGCDALGSISRRHHDRCTAANRVWNNRRTRHSRNANNRGRWAGRGDGKARSERARRRRGARSCVTGNSLMDIGAFTHGAPFTPRMHTIRLLSRTLQEEIASRLAGDD